MENSLPKCIAASLLVGSFVFTGVGVTQAESIPQIDNNLNRYVWVESDERFSAYFDVTQIYAADIGWLEHTLAHAVYKRVFGKDYEPKH